VQDGAAPDALLPDAAFVESRSDDDADASEVWGSTSSSRSPPDPRADPGPRPPVDPDRVPRAAVESSDDPRARRRRATGSRWRRSPASPRAVDGRPVLQSNVAGYKAALLGADNMGRFYPMLMTAAGTIPPAKVLVLGVRGGGLRRSPPPALGARTTGYDVRPRSPKQVQSLGAQWLRSGSRGQRRGRLRRELTEEERARQQQALTAAIKGSTLVITTALVPGRPAPRLVTAEAVEGMKPGR